MMFTSELIKIDPETVEEFQWQGLEEQNQVPPPEPVEFQLWDYSLPECTRQEGRAVEAKVEDILAAAHLKAQDIEQQAYEEGFQQGQKDGQEVGRRALEEVVKRLQGLVTTLEQDRESLFKQREGVLLDLVLLISEKLVARELNLHPEAIRQIIEESFRQWPIRKDCDSW